jgi:hypothetical protein
MMQNGTLEVFITRERHSGICNTDMQNVQQIGHACWMSSVLDHGRPSISSSIRSIKMYSWNQCTEQERLVCSGDVPCVTQEEQGFGPSTLSTYPLPIHLGYWGLSLPATWDQDGQDPITPKRGFQVSKGELRLQSVYMYIIIV